MLTYTKGDLFAIAENIKKSSSSPFYLAHACNCQGAWGAGIAHTFKLKYYKDYLEYNDACTEAIKWGDNLCGGVLLTSSNIICLMTAAWYGKRTDSPKDIINNTKKAFKSLDAMLPKNAVVYSPKFNSGLFRVPWHESEKILKDFLTLRPDIHWTVVEWTE